MNHSGDLILINTYEIYLTSLKVLILCTVQNGSKTFKKGCPPEGLSQAIALFVPFVREGLGVNGCLHGERKGTVLPTYA